MSRKKMAFEEPGAAMGHNKPKSDKRRMEIVNEYIRLENEKQKLVDQQKIILQEGKDEGFLKTAIRNTAKTLVSSPEQYQARREIENETKYTLQLYADKGGQWSWLATDGDAEKQQEDAA